MKICPACKAKYDEDKKFCRKCGVSLVSEKVMAPDVVAKRQSFEIHITQDPLNASLLAQYGEYLTSILLYDDALVQLHKALEIEPTNESFRRKVIDIYRAKQD